MFFVCIKWFTILFFFSIKVFIRNFSFFKLSFDTKHLKPSAHYFKFSNKKKKTSYKQFLKKNPYMIDAGDDLRENSDDFLTNLLTFVFYSLLLYFFVTYYLFSYLYSLILTIFPDFLFELTKLLND